MDIIHVLTTNTISFYRAMTLAMDSTHVQAIMYLFRLEANLAMDIMIYAALMMHTTPVNHLHWLLGQDPVELEAVAAIMP